MDTAAPYGFMWDASAATVGSHVLTARAIDAAGNAATSTVAVNVPTPPDTTPPTVGITAPTAGANLLGFVAITAAASDNVTITSVEFRADGVLVGSDNIAPYTRVWDTSTVAIGSHTLTARALDAAGNAATSTVAVNVVTPPDTTAPVVAITAPTAGSVVSGSVALSASASDNVAVSRVEFRADGVLVGTDTTAPYTSTWDASAAAVGSHILTARVVDTAGNATTTTVTVNVPAPPDTTAPAPVAAISVARTGSATLYWTNPV